MSHYLTIKNAIINKLLSINELKAVYPYETGSVAGYPFAVVHRFNVKGYWIDAATNEREWHFSVRIFQEMNKEAKGAGPAENTIDSIADLVFDVFDNDWTLGGRVDLCQVSGGNSWEDRELLMRVLELEISVKKIFNTQ